MAKQVTSATTSSNPLIRLKSFFQEVRVEMSKVTWPTLDEVKSSTTIVMMLLAILASIVFVYDKVFEKIIVTLLKLG